MIFASAIFLAGLLAVAAPIAIHLLARQRTRTLPWGAMEFLQQSIQSASSRRRRLRDLLLLLLRVLAIALIALAFAQPFLSRALLGGRDLETIFVWDVSLSTEAFDEGGEPVHVAMEARLREELDRLRDRSSVRILVAGAETRWLKPEPLPLSSANRQVLERAIEDEPQQAGESRLANAILRAMDLPSDEDGSTPRYREIVVIHDSQRRAWQADTEATWAAIHRRLEADSDLSLRAIDPGVMPSRELPQVAVTGLEIGRDTLAPEMPVRMRVTVRNHSETQAATGDVVWQIDGREVERTPEIRLEPDGELALEEVLRFETTGSHLAACLFETDADALPADNQAVAAVSVREALPILVVDDTRRTQRGQIRPSEFLAASLGASLVSKEKETPKKKEKEAKEDPGKQPGAITLFTPRVIRSDAWQTEQLAEQSAVFLVALEAPLPEARIAEIANFVEQGGGLWLMLNAQEETPAAWAVSLLTRLGLEPLSVASRSVAPDRDQPFRLKASDEDSPFALGIVAQRLDLHRAELRSLHALDQPLVLPEERLLETPEGIPFLVSLPVGAGRVVLQTADLGRQNTNLPILQAFVPFVREIAWDTAGASLPRRNLSQGEAIRITAADAATFLGGPELERPDGARRPLQFRGGHFESRDTRLPGIYRLYGPQDGRTDESDEERFAVSRPAAESRLEYLEASEIDALLLPKSPDSNQAETESRGKSPLAFWLACLAALFFLAESLLARSIAADRAQRQTRLDLKPLH